MKSRTINTIVSLALVISILSSLSLSASAYNLLNYNHRSYKIYYYYDNWVGARAIQFIAKGANAWKAKNTDAKLLPSSSNPQPDYDVVISTTNRTDVSWDGLTQTTWETKSPYYIISQTVAINTAQTKTWNNDGALQSVVVHEMGHVFGLGENGFSKTIMNAYTWGSNSRYGGYGLTDPQADDVNGVNAKY